MKRLLITITTYNRPVMLRRLLKQIRSQAIGFQTHIIVFDDCSDYELSSASDCVELGVDFDTGGVHLGREGFWELIDSMFEAACGEGFDYWIHLPDDVELRPRFFDQAISLFDAVKRTDDKIATLSPLRCKGWYHKQWTGYEPQERMGGAVWQIQWNDCVWIADRQLGEALNWQINPIDWDVEPNTSSRVPAQISKRLHAAGYTMYGVGESLLTYDDHPSLMNPKERVLNPLTT